jgi:hypothetical protein
VESPLTDIEEGLLFPLEAWRTGVVACQHELEFGLFFRFGGILKLPTHAVLLCFNHIHVLIEKATMPYPHLSDLRPTSFSARSD